MLKPMIGSLVVAALATPALATEYWVQYDYPTHTCSVVQSDTHQTATRFPWSPPNDGSRPKDVPKGPAGGNTGSATVGANETAPPDGLSRTSEPANDRGGPNGSNTEATTNQTGNSAASNNQNGGRAFTDTYDESESPVVAEWKRRAELAKKEHIDVTTALIGSPMRSQEEAEAEMQIMRMCGLKP